MSNDVPVTIWRPTDGNSEFSIGTTSAIVDTAAVALVDTTGIAVVDTGVDQTIIPATTWSEDDGV